MTSWKLVRVIAGLLILLSLVLGMQESPLFISHYWLYFTTFIGINLLQSGFTGWCLMENIMRKLGVPAGC